MKLRGSYERYSTVVPKLITFTVNIKELKDSKI